MRPAYLLALLVLLATARAARADESMDLGTSATGLPGSLRLGLPVVGAQRYALAVDAAYAFTEASDEAPGSHHRPGAQLAFGAGLTPWLALALSGQAARALHADDTASTVDWLSDAHLRVRLGARAASSAQLGLELDARVPGGVDGAPAPAGLSLDGRALGAFALGSHGTLLASLGMRLERSDRAVDDASTLGAADRLVLDLGARDALLLGLGFAQRFGALELLAEVGADLWVGTSGSQVSGSPIEITAGARYRVTDRFELELRGGASPGERPSLAPDAPLVRVPPRAHAALGARFALGEVSRPGAQAEQAQPPEPPASSPTPIVAEPPRQPEPPAATEPVTDVAPTPEPAPEAVPAPVPEAVPAPAPEAAAAAPAPEARGVIRGQVRAFSGQPLTATVTVYPLDLKATTDAEGKFELTVPAGAYTVRLRAFGYSSQNRRIAVSADGVTLMNVELRKK